MTNVKNDRALRFYNNVLGLERLHYGLWFPEEELSFANLRTAQKRYEDYLIENIPKGVKKILDVGCGTGVLSARLKELGYDVEGLSPDINQKEIFTDKVNARFHFCCFEDFSTGSQYDCIIMSESSQYIPLDSLFKVAARSLSNKAYLMVCDYFVLEHASGVLAKSGHKYDQFMNVAKSEGFQIIQSEDITNKVTKTLEMAKDFVEKFSLGVDIATEKIRGRHPYLTRLTSWLLKKRITSFKDEIQLLDAERFKENKTYQFILFQRQS